ncbi:MAG: hypothetical protein ABEH43_01675, partial [Flavobacteriales bacterium]
MKQQIFTILLFLGTTLSVFATHNRAGEITYEHLGGNEYQFTITTCTKESAPADRPTLVINWGDGTKDSVSRDREIILPNNSKRNIYRTTHIFAGPGTYQIWVLDPNRNSGVINIENSVNIPFCIKSKLVINPFIEGANNSVRLSNNACNLKACKGIEWCYNPGAYDPDGDSLVYSLVESRGGDTSGGGVCKPIDNYAFPDECSDCKPGSDNNMTIDRNTGELCWDAPQKEGEYNVAIKIKEFRNGQFIGHVIRDMQIDVDSSCNNTPPKIDKLKDTCVIAGNNLNKMVTATDMNDQITLSAFGKPFEVNDPATFPTVFDQDQVKGQFSWDTKCSHIRNSSYQATFKAEDNESNDVQMVDFEDLFIQVIAPPPKNAKAEPNGNAIKVTWDKSNCSDVKRYKIYRRVDSAGLNPGHCETGLPPNSGYSKIGETSGPDDLSYNDENLSHGIKYCYVVIGCYEDGSESIVSNETCSKLVGNVPMITKSSVGKTDKAKGIDTIKWKHPFEQIDTVNQYPGPYYYKIYRSKGFENGNQNIATTDTSAELYKAPKKFIDTSSHNTKDNAYTYKAELYSDDASIGFTNIASSPFLKIKANDNQLKLKVKANVPWLNFKYEIFRKDKTTSKFIKIDSTVKPTYIDKNLPNKVEQCYYVKTSAIGVKENDTIINFSQINCKHPVDKTPPCPPQLSIKPNCESISNKLSWNPPSSNCADDVVSYNLYYTPEKGKNFIQIDSNIQANITSTQHNNNNSIAGCYYITALDSARSAPNNNPNESDKSNIVCADNCPVYNLPNVFTPNGDDKNDIFRPLSGYKFIKSGK